MSRKDLFTAEFLCKAIFSKNMCHGWFHAECTGITLQWFPLWQSVSHKWEALYMWMFLNPTEHTAQIYKMSDHVYLGCAIDCKHITNLWTVTSMDKGINTWTFLFLSPSLSLSLSLSLILSLSLSLSLSYLKSSIACNKCVSFAGDRVGIKMVVFDELVGLLVHRINAILINKKGQK